MNEQEEPATPEPAAAPETPPPLPSFDPEPSARSDNPLDELKSWFRDLKSHLKGAVEEAREASAEKRAEMFEEYERRAGRRS